MLILLWLHSKLPSYRDVVLVVYFWYWVEWEAEKQLAGGVRGVLFVIMSIYCPGPQMCLIASLCPLSGYFSSPWQWRSWLAVYTILLSHSPKMTIQSSRDVDFISRSLLLTRNFLLFGSDNQKNKRKFYRNKIKLWNDFYNYFYFQSLHWFYLTPSEGYKQVAGNLPSVWWDKPMEGTTFFLFLLSFVLLSYFWYL